MLSGRAGIQGSICGFIRVLNIAMHQVQYIPTDETRVFALCRVMLICMAVVFNLAWNME